MDIYILFNCIDISFYRVRVYLMLTLFFFKNPLYGHVPYKITKNIKKKSLKKFKFGQVIQVLEISTKNMFMSISKSTRDRFFFLFFNLVLHIYVIIIFSKI